MGHLNYWVLRPITTILVLYDHTQNLSLDKYPVQFLFFLPKLKNRINPQKVRNRSEIINSDNAHNMSQYYFVLRSLHKARPNTTLHYKACTKHIPVLLYTTKLAQSTSQYYFILQSLHKAHTNTTLYYKDCPQQVPVLLCITKLAQSRSQYYFILQSLYTSKSQYYCILQSLYKACPNTTLYYKALKKKKDEIYIRYKAGPNQTANFDRFREPRFCKHPI